MIRQDNEMKAIESTNIISDKDQKKINESLYVLGRMYSLGINEETVLEQFINEEKHIIDGVLSHPNVKIWQNYIDYRSDTAAYLVQFIRNHLEFLGFFAFHFSAQERSFLWQQLLEYPEVRLEVKEQLENGSRAFLRLPFEFISSVLDFDRWLSLKLSGIEQQVTLTLEDLISSPRFNANKKLYEALYQESEKYHENKVSCFINLKLSPGSLFMILKEIPDITDEEVLQHALDRLLIIAKQTPWDLVKSKAVFDLLNRDYSYCSDKINLFYDRMEAILTSFIKEHLTFYSTYKLEKTYFNECVNEIYRLLSIVDRPPRLSIGGFEPEICQYISKIINHMLLQEKKSISDTIQAIRTCWWNSVITEGLCGTIESGALEAMYQYLKKSIPNRWDSVASDFVMLQSVLNHTVQEVLSLKREFGGGYYHHKYNDLFSLIAEQAWRKRADLTGQDREKFTKIIQKFISQYHIVVNLESMNEIESSNAMASSQEEMSISALQRINIPGQDGRLVEVWIKPAELGNLPFLKESNGNRIFSATKQENLIDSAECQNNVDLASSPSGINTKIIDTTNKVSTIEHLACLSVLNTQPKVNQARMNNNEASCADDGEKSVNCGRKIKN